MAGDTQIVVDLNSMTACRRETPDNAVLWSHETLDVPARETSAAESAGQAPPGSSMATAAKKSSVIFAKPLEAESPFGAGGRLS